MAAEIIDRVRALVECESPSNDRDALTKCADIVARIGEDAVGVAAERLGAPGSPVLRWTFGGDPRVLLIGHFDTVWPMGTLARWPMRVSVADDRMSGPGVFDMKTGIVIMFDALASLDSLDGIVVLLNSDEETGSESSRTLIEAEARSVGPEGAALILEPSAGGAVKTGRKGVSMYTLHIDGRAAHAGLEPEKGANATIEAAHQVLAIAELGRSSAGTTVTPTALTSGTTRNTVPASAQLLIDVRAETDEEQRRVDKEIRTLAARVDGTSLRLEGSINRPPLPRTSSAALFENAQRVARELGQPELAGVSVGGGSDGNFTAGVGVPTLDGLGAIGDHAHAEGEYAVISAIPARTALVARLITSLLRS